MKQHNDDACNPRSPSRELILDVLSKSPPFRNSFSSVPFQSVSRSPVNIPFIHDQLFGRRRGPCLLVKFRYQQTLISATACEQNEKSLGLFII